MLTITDGGSLTRALKLPLDLRLKGLLIQRRDQLGGDITGQARFLVMRSGDSLPELEKALGFKVLSDPELSFGCEWVADHGAFYEAVWILTDDGFAHVVLINKSADTHPELLKLCSSYATQHV